MQTSKKAIDDKFIITTIIFMKRCTRALSSVTDSLSNEAEHQKRKPNAVIKLEQISSKETTAYS